MKIIYHVYKYRIDKGLTVRQLSELSGVSKSMINNIENRKCNPTLYSLCLIASALGVPVEKLYTVIQ